MRVRRNKPKGSRNKKQGKQKRFNYNVDDPPCLNFQGVCEFLGEVPLSRKKATVWNTFDKVFDLYWGSDDSNIKRRTGWNQKYRLAYQKVLEMLVEIDDPDSAEFLSRRFGEKVKALFEYYCPCIPATCPATWIAPNGGSRDTATWLAFRQDGTQDGDATLPDELSEQENSWTRIRRSIKLDQMFCLSVRDVIVIERIEELMVQRRIMRFRSYDGGQRELIFYQDDESAQRSTAELRNARANRQRRIQEMETEFRKPFRPFKQILRANKLEEERQATEDVREWDKRRSRNEQCTREKKKREERIRKDESLRIIKEHFTPLQIFERTFANGRPPKRSRSDDDDPLSYANLRKAVKKGTWEM